jgi:hypothetical protein
VAPPSDITVHIAPIAICEVARKYPSHGAVGGCYGLSPTSALIVLVKTRW